MASEPSHSPGIHEGSSVAKRLWNAAMSLQCKATGLVVVLTLAVTAVVSGYLLRSGGELARDQHDTQMVQMAKVLAKAAATTMASGDRDTLKALAKDAANGSPLLYVIFSDVDGRQLTVAEHSSANVLQRLYRDQSERAPVPGRPVFHQGTVRVPVFLDVTYPIALRASTDDSSHAASTTLLGYVRTGMVASGWHETMSSKLDLVVGVGILATMAAVPLGFLLIRRIVSPLDGLANAMLRFSRGDLNVRSPVRRRDEIGRLTIAFNRMADQYQHTHERIIRLNAELERRVAQRTQQLRELASRDPLTGLYNRRYFNEMLERRFSEAARYETDLSCIMIDLDGFKAVNDAFGHHVGDELLVLTAETTTSQLRSADVAARFGGDEFVVLLPQTDADRARVLGERIAEKFTRDAAQHLPQVCASMSMGIASQPSLDIEDAETLIRTADHALYDAKAAGKNRIVMAASVSKPATI
ncbi:MAG: diguanylate cyclase [Phycisphaerae bacterium]